MRVLSIIFIVFSYQLVAGQYYDKARDCFERNQLDSARYFINKNLARKPNAEDYFLSALIHEMEGADLRALADYEAAIQSDFGNIEAYFQKGLIYFENGNHSKAIEDFTHVIENFDQSETNAIYFGNDLHGANRTFMTTLQSMKGRVYQYRAMAYKETEKWRLAMEDFEQSLMYDSSIELFINRSQLHSVMGNDASAISDLRKAVKMEPDSYLAWYNLALLDESARLPDDLLDDESFSPMLNLMGANAYETQDYTGSINYYSKSIETNPEDDLALIGRGKALLRIRSYQQARADFIKALQLNPRRTESFYLIGNSFFYEEAYKDAIGFYEQYLSIDPTYANAWYNAAMSYLSLNDSEKACSYLKKASNLYMSQAEVMITKYCEGQ